MSRMSKAIILLLCSVLIFVVATIQPAEAKIQKQIKPLTQEDMDKSKKFVETSLKVNPDGSFYINKKEALKIYTPQELKNVQNTFNSLDKTTLSKIYNQYGSIENPKQNVELPDTTTYFVPAIPIVYFGIWELLAALGATGATALVAKFTQDMYTHGVKSACKKFASKNAMLNKWCYHNGYL
ncbi:hypothetical protein [Macrococcoides caseolyticum]|uniref:hypothetical protein n=1 Tax=Macrococcoides caseolyticum TaxID=69966 RepID=UPI000C336BD7|nr:hypothetical protein [Macrococcus caseolyticus]PKE16002.1 hypothetical protein CW718_11965 [Macrococcus caseolyticus]